MIGPWCALLLPKSGPVATLPAQVGCLITTGVHAGPSATHAPATPKHTVAVWLLCHDNGLMLTLRDVAT